MVEELKGNGGGSGGGSGGVSDGGGTGSDVTPSVSMTHVTIKLYIVVSSDLNSGCEFVFCGLWCWNLSFHTPKSEGFFTPFLHVV